MNWNALIIGLTSLVLGLIGIVIKSNVPKDQKGSYSSAQIIVGTCALLGAGLVLIILSFIE